MKKIVRFIDKRLKHFFVNLRFEKKLTYLGIQSLADFTHAIAHIFPKAPKLGLIPQTSQPFEVNIGPLVFFDEANKNSVQISQEFIVFSFQDYDSWIRELSKITEFLKTFGEIFKPPKIEKIVMTYVNQFQIPKLDFQFNRYFTFPDLQNPPNWKIHFHDINIGIVPFEESTAEMNRKAVLRFNTGGISAEYFLFYLESVFSLDLLNLDFNDDFLEECLDDAHRRIIDIFINFLSPEYRDILGLEVSEIDQ